MTLLEVLPYLEEGKPIRKYYWDECEYIRLSKSGIIVDQNGDDTLTAIDLRNVWEVVYTVREDEE